MHFRDTESSNQIKSLILKNGINQLKRYLWVGKMRYYRFAFTFFVLLGFFFSFSESDAFSNNTQNLILQLATCHLMEHGWKTGKSLPATVKKASVHLFKTFLVANSALQIPQNLTPNCSILSQYHCTASSSYNTFKSLNVNQRIQILIRIK